MNSLDPVSYFDLKAKLPPPWDSSQLTFKNEHTLKAKNRRYFILDDDPTGTQTIKDVPVLTDWSITTLGDILKQEDRVIFLSTNSRALTEEEAKVQILEILDNISIACNDAGLPYDVISRSDSTLRGHFPLDVDFIVRHFEIHNNKISGVLIVPSFPTGGRFTLGGIQWVQSTDESIIPVADTAYAKDSTFGFQNSDIKQWMVEKSLGSIPSSEIGLLDLNLIRNEGPEGIAKYLKKSPFFTVIDAITEEDLDVILAGIALIEEEGQRFVVRSASSFIRARAGLPGDLRFNIDSLNTLDSPGLIVVGSHVPTTTDQINYLIKNTEISYIEININDLLCNSDEIIARYAYEINQELEDGNHVLIATQRKVVSTDDKNNSLKLSRTVSKHLATIVSQIKKKPSFLIAKGGITSADVATVGLGLKRATVLGPLLPGIPVWKVEDATRFRDIPYIIFPGNVGKEDTLLRGFKLLTSRNKNDLKNKNLT